MLKKDKRIHQLIGMDCEKILFIICKILWEQISRNLKGQFWSYSAIKFHYVVPMKDFGQIWKLGIGKFNIHKPSVTLEKL